MSDQAKTRPTWVGLSGGTGPQAPSVRLAWFSVWLVFLAYPVGDLIGGRIDGAGAVVALVGLGLFVVVYESLVLRHPWGSPSASARRPTAMLVALAVLAIGLRSGSGPTGSASSST